MTTIVWKDLHHRQLSVSDCYQCLALRNAVFIVEQQCLYQDIDGEDLLGDNRHLLGFHGEKLVAYARLRVPEDREAPLAIGRVIVAVSARGQGLAGDLMRKMLDSCRQHFPARGVGLSAQAHLQRFYASHGFQAYGEVYQEDGIDHIAMVLQR